MRSADKAAGQAPVPSVAPQKLAWGGVRPAGEGPLEGSSCQDLARGGVEHWLAPVLRLGHSRPGGAQGPLRGGLRGRQRLQRGLRCGLRRVEWPSTIGVALGGRTPHSPLLAGVLLWGYLTEGLCLKVALRKTLLRRKKLQSACPTRLQLDALDKVTWLSPLSHYPEPTLEGGWPQLVLSLVYKRTQAGFLLCMERVCLLHGWGGLCTVNTWLGTLTCRPGVVGSALKLLLWPWGGVLQVG